MCITAKFTSQLLHYLAIRPVTNMAGNLPKLLPMTKKKIHPNNWT